MLRKLRFFHFLTALFMAAVLLLPLDALAQRRGGSFGGGGRSFSSGRSSFGGFGGGSTRSSFGSGSTRSSFGSGSTRGSFGGGSTRGSFGGIRSGSGSTRVGSGSFGSGTNRFGGPRTFTSTQSRGGSPFAPRGGTFSRSGYSYYGGYHYYNGLVIHSYGGWGSYWFHPAWYYWTPFHPAFYYGSPVMVNGYYEPGGFSFMRMMIGVLFFIFIVWLISRLFRL